MTSGGAHLVPPGPAANWRQVAYAAPTLAEPITIAEWWKNRRGESIRLVLSQFQGRSIFDLRTWYTGDDGKLRPGKGFAAEVRHLPRLAAAIAKAEAKARELGLIGDKGAADE
jgi:Transcriptional Coactivator p15 (PC4)